MVADSEVNPVQQERDYAEWRHIDRQQRSERMRVAIRYLIDHEMIGPGRRTGAQEALARHFGVTRQRIGQIAKDELEHHESRMPAVREPS
jgi:hypothetical protein